mgnify:CR=1 FL=1|tara:strand:- start:2578 stop:3783 length:1206 start_codon:yes stop_codon:yes gene_type:complete
MDLIKILPYTMENKILKEQLLVVAPSFLDELGHFEYINEISNGLSDNYEVSILCQHYEQSSVVTEISSKYSLIVKDFNFLSLGDSLETKILLKDIPFLKNIIHGIVKLVFHLKVHSYVARSEVKNVLYLETEPLSLLFFKGLNSKYKKLIVTLHAVDFDNNHSGLKKFYKLILKFVIKKISHKISSFAVHNSKAKDRLISLNVPKNKVFISGWGITKSKIKPKKIDGELVTCLAFGVMRKSKRIESLINVFLEANDPRLELKLVGKSIDLDMALLNKLIIESKSKTTIELDDRFIPREEFEEIFKRADLFVLSHDKTFQSISGPLFNAVESNRPILCFSYADTREMVIENNLGECADLEKLKEPLYDLAKRAIQSYQPDSMNYYLWEEIVNRIKTNLEARY